MVLAENPETGEVEYKEVLETYENETTELIHVHVNGEDIVTTPSHPFYVNQFGWIRAAQLRAGDVLVLSNGEYVVVEFIQHEILESPVKVYNFEVEDFHTYFVGESSVLVHNGCGDDEKPHTRNGKLAGSNHPVTNVPFDQSGYPVFDSKFNVQLKTEQYLSSDYMQFNEANSQLKAAIQSGNVSESLFTASQLDEINAGVTPLGYIWHHHQDEGILQLVDAYEHAKTGHTGGRSIWGGGSSHR